MAEAEDAPPLRSRTPVPTTNKGFHGISRAANTRYMKWLAQMGQRGIIATNHNFLTFDTRGKPWGGGQSEYIVAVRLNDAGTAFGCARCAEPAPTRHAGNLSRSWPPPEGWNAMGMKDEYTPLKLREAHLLVKFLLCPKCSEQLEAVLKRVEEPAQ